MKGLVSGGRTSCETGCHFDTLGNRAATARTFAHHLDSCPKGLTQLLIHSAGEFSPPLQQEMM